MPAAKPSVSVLKASYQLGDEAVEEKVFKAVELIGGLPERLRSASKILVKPNLGYTDARRHKGRLIALSEPSVTRAVLKMIRDENKGEVIISDNPGPAGLRPLAEKLGYGPMLKEFRVRLVDADNPPFVEVEVPRGTTMRRYTLNKEVAEADATVSIAKMKVHLFCGVSLCMKNLFGLPPPAIYGAPRFYLHYPFRLPRCLVDLAMVFKPSLNIIEGLVGEDLQEWHGPPVESNVLIAGDNIVATDSVGARLMGFNPQSEFPEVPFLQDINHIRLAAAVGLGPNDLSQIELSGDRLEEATTQFHRKLAMGLPPEAHLKAREQLAKDALYYRQHLSELLAAYEGRYVGIVEGRLAWTARDIAEARKMYEMPFTFRRREESRYATPFIKKVEPPDRDPEVYDAYANP